MESLPRKERLRGAARIDELFSAGKVGKKRLVIVRALENGLGHTRVAMLAGKAAGKANVRNRLRRRLRAVYRTNKEHVAKGWDLVILPRRGALEARTPELVKDLLAAIDRATGAE